MQSTKIDSQQIMQFSSMFDVGSFERILGDKYDVYDHTELFYQPEYADFLTGNQLTNMGFIKLEDKIEQLMSRAFYVGRGSIVRVDNAVNLNLQIFSGIADDTTRYRSTYGVGGDLCLAGVWSDISYLYMVEYVSADEVYLFLPFGAALTFTSGGSYSIIEQGVYNYVHSLNEGGLDDLAINRWDGSYYFGHFTNMAFGFALPVLSLNFETSSLGIIEFALDANAQRSLGPYLYSNIFMGFQPTRPSSFAFYGKRFVPKSPPQNDFSVPWLEIL